MLTLRARRLLAPGAALGVALLLVGACSIDDDGAEVGADDSTLEAGGGSATDEACAGEVVEEGDDGATVVEAVESAASEDGLTSVVYRVTRAGEVVAAGAVGDSMTGVPADQSMHYRNGNVAFAYMGTLLLLMEEAGEVSLDDTVSTWLPDLDVPEADAVTLQMLAQSTSGYPDYVPDEDFVTSFEDDPFQQYTAQDLIDVAMQTPPHYPPGEAWSYAHTNYVILGEALAAAGGAPLDELLQERVIEPMGLEHTAPALTPEVPEPVLHTFSTERGLFEDTTFWNPSWQTAPGSVITTNTCDLAASAEAVGTGALLSEQPFERMVAPDTAELGPPPSSCPEGVCRELTDDLYYGMGVIVMRDWIVQTPLFGGAGAVHAYLPSEQLAVAIVAVTGAESEAGTNHAQQIWQSIAEQLTPENVPAR